ncbi:MAG: KEOPS complex subunit Pcc1 [Saccharolobus sp.]|uniref:KEOPS complex Pcc1-like subunit n=1 Tax=Saccharolobus caldissimus TaxID=1702097 RepID=A0AAQ4CPD7_9CREN|nr:MULTISPECIES: KEOPS complex subunit Pcc1 [Saccharolobus]MDT7860842.1 KEOPS complex subunit Pcc1 [Saccharolobus sp.]BDB97668.1 KEOPS complex Pcc1-like subunit [Saccharolobus caldissimus]
MLRIKILINSEDNERDKIDNIIYNSIIVEKVDIKYVKVKREPFEIEINAPSVTRARAIMNSYILWLYTILKSLEEVEKSG